MNVAFHVPFIVLPIIYFGIGLVIATVVAIVTAMNSGICAPLGLGGGPSLIGLGLLWLVCVPLWPIAVIFGIWNLRH